MSRTFEGLIRPFQSVDVTYPRAIPKVGDDAVVPNIVLVIGKAGGTKTLGMSLSASTTSYVEKVQVEVTEEVAI